MTWHIFADADWIPLDHPHSVGRLAIDRVRGKESMSFEYDADWIDSPHALLLDPELQLVTGRQYAAAPSQASFGVFADSSPDRWGRMLMQRREAQLARQSDPQAVGLALNINEFDNSLDFVLALEVAPLFRLDEPTAQTILEQVSTSVGNWRSVARELDISRAEQERMRLAFEH